MLNIHQTHIDICRNRNKWFDKMDQTHTQYNQLYKTGVHWWINRNTRPFMISALYRVPFITWYVCHHHKRETAITNNNSTEMSGIISRNLVTKTWVKFYISLPRMRACLLFHAKTSENGNQMIFDSLVLFNSKDRNRMINHLKHQQMPINKHAVINYY